MIRIWILFCACMFLVFTEAEASIVEGVISDAETGETLPGSSVVIEGTTTGTIADLDGHYSLNIAEGDYVLVVSFLGYSPSKISVTVAEKSKYVQNFLLVKSTTNLVEVVVSERASGQVRQLNAQRDADNIVNVVSQEQIESFPDLNAADALQRVPGITLTRSQGEGKYVQLRGTPPELTNFNVNGIQLPSPESSIRTVGMDVINASQIQTIEVTKVLTPDMNGDAIGGTVNLKTKRAEGFAPEFNVVLAGGYNNLRKTPNGEMQFTFSQRKGRIGFLVNANYIKSIQGADNMEFKYDKGAFFGGTGPDNYHLHYTEVQLRYYDITRERVGLSSTLDFSINENNLVYINGMFNRFDDQETRSRKVYNLDDPTSERNYLYGGIDHDLKDRQQIQTISTVSAGAEHTLRNKSLLKYELAWSKATELQPNRMEVVFENPGQAINIRFDMTDPNFPIATFPDPDNAGNAVDYQNYDMDKLLFENHSAIDENIIGRIDYEIPYKTGKFGGMIKVGALYRAKDKSRDVNGKSFGAYRINSNIYPISGDTLNLETVNDGFYEDDFLDRGYLLEAMPDPELMRDFYDRWPTLFIYGDAGITESRERTYSQDYTATEDVQAYYIMARQNFDKLMVLGGVRYERTDIDYEGYQVFKTSSGYFSGLDTITDGRTVEFLLPNIQFKYSLNPNFNVRAALTYTYARPNFRDVIPYRVQNERTEVRLGNPDLDYPSATNIDFMVERYWKGRNIISGGLFYKNIDNFIFNYQVFGYEGDPTEANYNKMQIELPLNGQSAYVAGAEFQLQAFFSKLPGKLKNFGTMINYTYTHSEGQISRRYPANDNINIVEIGGDYSDLFNNDEIEKIPLPGQAPNTLNLSLFYDSPKLYLKISANYNDEFLSTLGVDPDLDEFYGSQWRLDVNGYYQINEVVQVFGDMRNLTNAPLRYFLGDPENQRILQTEFYSFWARLGVRLKF